MRKLEAGVAISVIVHAGAFAYVAPSGARRDKAPLRIAAPVVAPAPAPPVVEVALLDDSPPAAVPPPRRAPAPIASIAPAPRVGPEAPPAAPRVGPEARPTVGKSLLAMRHGEAPGVALPAGLAVDLDHLPRAASPPPAPAPAPERPAGRVGHGTFDAKVAADGTVTLTDKPSARLVLPAVQALDDYRKTDHSLGGPAGDPAIASAYQPAPGTAINLGASSSINALPSSASLSRNADGKGTTVVVPLIGGELDATDILMRRHGIDPYRAQKLAYLDATRDERVQLGKLNRAEQLAHAADQMQRNLAALWADPRLDLAAKKRALFALWDECAEDGDPELVAGARDARRLVVTFIRDHLPSGRAGAYTPGELAALARHQQSRAVFQPYAG